MTVSVPRQKLELSLGSLYEVTRAAAVPPSAPALPAARESARWRLALLGVGLAAAVGLHSEAASAFPGVIAGKGDTARVSNSTQIVFSAVYDV